MGKKDNKGDKGKLELATEDFSTDGSDLIIEPVDESSSVEDTTNTSNNEDSDKLKDELLYLKAEFDNFKKRTIKERSDLIKFGPERLAVEVVGILDIFEMALANDVSPENLDSFKEGMDMTYSQLKAVLGKFGIVELNPIGETFDPNIHEALSSMPTDDYEEGSVCQVFKKGFKFHEKMIRPAQVVVAKASTDSE